jgi:uncharacterized membrane protein YeaQ/YmgE (transglycosylase-associated protein family)
MGGLIFWLISTMVSGGVIGGIGRLLVPARKLVGLSKTVLCGIAGSLVGGLIAGTIFSGGRAHWLLAVMIEVLVASAFVALLAWRRGNRWA